MHITIGAFIIFENPARFSSLLVPSGVAIFPMILIDKLDRATLVVVTDVVKRLK